MTLLIWLLVLSTSLLFGYNVVRSFIIRKEANKESDIKIFWTVYITSIILSIAFMIGVSIYICYKVFKISIGKMIKQLLPFDTNSKNIAVISSFICVMLFVPIGVSIPPTLNTTMIQGDDENYYSKMNLLTFFSSISFIILVLWLLFCFLFFGLHKFDDKNT
jgi:hypothetical protein